MRAAEAAFGLDLTPRERSIVARHGSGSAARSIFGGFVEMHAGTAADGSDSFAEPLLDGAEWPLEVVIAVTAKGEKEVGSRSGMTRSATSSPYYAAWVAGQPADLAVGASGDPRARLRGARRGRRAQLPEDARRGARGAAAARLLERRDRRVPARVRRLRAGGVPVFFTIDAGPQVKAVCAPGARATGRADAARGARRARAPDERARSGRGALLSDRRARSRQARRARRVRRARRRAGRRARASTGTSRSTIAPSADGVCRLTTRTGDADRARVRARASRAASPLVDLVGASAPLPLAWNATIDSRRSSRRAASSASARAPRSLCAWAGASRRSRGRRARRRGPDVDGAHRAAPAVPRRARAAASTSPRRTRAGRSRSGSATSRYAPNWFSPPAEQCRIRGYFCRPVRFDARVGCALSGLAPGSAAGGDGAACAG